MVSFVIEGGVWGAFSPKTFSYFPPPGTAFSAFSETDFWIYPSKYFAYILEEGTFTGGEAKWLVGGGGGLWPSQLYS